MAELTPSIITAIISVIAGIQLILLTIVQAWISARKEKRDYARQDEVANRITVLHRENVIKSDAIAALAKVADDRIRKHLKTIDEQGKQIHILVNSDMTAARTSERDQVKITLIALKRVQALSNKLGVPNTPEENEAIDIAEKRIEELNLILADRHAAFLLLEKQEERMHNEE